MELQMSDNTSERQLPKHAIVEVRLEIRIPEEATPQQVEDWLRYRLNDNGHLPGGNPLRNHEVEPWGTFGFEWGESGYVGIEEEYDHQPTAGGISYKVRRRRE